MLRRAVGQLCVVLVLGRISGGPGHPLHRVRTALIGSCSRDLTRAGRPDGMTWPLAPGTYADTKVGHTTSLVNGLNNRRCYAVPAREAKSTFSAVAVPLVRPG